MVLRHGQPVELRNEYTGTWASGFEVIDVVNVARDERATVEYRVRRCSDGSVIPALFPPRRVRAINAD